MDSTARDALSGGVLSNRLPAGGAPQPAHGGAGLSGAEADGKELDGSAPDGDGRFPAGVGCPPCGALGRLPARFRTRDGAPGRLSRGPGAALPDCKFATVNQLFGGDPAAERNWSGVGSGFVDMVAAIASAESREAVAGGCWWS